MSELETGAAPAASEGNAIASTPEITQVQVVPTTTPSIEDTMGEIFDKHHPETRVNRENGKFVSKTAEGAETAEPAKELNQEPVADKLETVKADTPTPSTKPRPQSWSADLDKWWSELPPERQDFLSKRESESHQKITQLGEKAGKAEKYDAVLTRYKHVLTDAPDREIESLLATKEAFLRDKIGTFQRLAQQLDIDLSQFAQAPNGEQPPENAHIRSLSQQVTQLQRQLGETTNRLTARERHEMEARELSLANLVDDFKKDKDYWPDIESEVLSQIVAIKAASPEKDPQVVLKEAHDRAIKLNDEVATRLSKAKRDKDAADKAAADKKKADEAKRLASLNAKSSSSGAPKAAFKSFEAEMGDIYDKVSARA